MMVDMAGRKKKQLELLAGEQHKACSKCKTLKPLMRFRKHSGHSDGYRSQCRGCEAEARRIDKKRYVGKHPDRVRARHRSSAKKLRSDILLAYGGSCACCGESRHEFLAIDHINNDGASHRRQLGSDRIYSWLKRNGFPRDRFQLLCHNCNCSKGLYGYCPHQREPARSAEQDPT